MREWEQVRRHLNATIDHPRSIRLFAEIAREKAPLAVYATPSALVTFIQETQRHPATNVLLLLIVDTSRRGPLCRSDLANQILWLGLWPLLNAIYWRQVRFWPQREGDLAAEIARCLATVVRGTDLTRVESVALTLVRDTERDLIEARQTELAYEGWQARAQFWAPILLAATGNEEAQELARERIDFLRLHLGADFDLVLAAYETACDFDRLQQRFGLAEDEIKARIRRAWRRFRKLTANRIE